jgi:hypothetical protein
MARPSEHDKVVHIHNSGEAQIEGQRPLLVEPGVYDLAFQFHETAYLFGRAPKVVCHFKIETPGQHYGKALVRYFNAMTLTSKPRRGGSFKIGWKSDLLREYATCFGLPARIDRLSLESFKQRVIRGRVIVVSRDSKNRSIPEPLRYSVIAELLGVVA